MSEVWELFYWANLKEDGKNHMIGRGEFVRLMFEVAGVEYIDHGVKDGNASSIYTSSVFNFVKGDGNKGFPCFAPPVIKKGDFVLSQTPVIMKYLGKKFNLYPTTEEDEAHAESINAFITDFIAEGRLVFHSKNFYESYYTQKDTEQVKTTIEWFSKERLPKFLTYLEKVIAFNHSQNPNSDYFIGNSLTYVDIAVFHTLVASEFQFPESYKSFSKQIPLLCAFSKRIAELPKLKEYLESDRRGYFEGNSMM